MVFDSFFLGEAKNSSPHPYMPDQIAFAWYAVHAPQNSVRENKKHHNSV